MENRSIVKGICDLPFVLPTPIEGDVICSHTVSEGINRFYSSLKLDANTIDKHVKGAGSDMNLL